MFKWIKRLLAPGPVATITTIEGKRHHTEYKEVEGRPGWVQIFVDGQPGCVFPKKPLDVPGRVE